MASDKEKIELFCEENTFDSRLTPKYIKFITETFDSFRSFSDVAYEIDRQSKTFKTLNKYHAEAIKDKEYQKLYMEAVDEAAKQPVQKEGE